MKTIHAFEGQYRFLSNFYVSPIHYKGRSWRTAEHAYQAMKSDDPVIWDRFLLMPTPGAAKRYGRSVVLKEGWEEVKDKIMFKIVLAKFSEPHLGQKLLETGDAALEEGNLWGDTYWGICPPASGVGNNKLGKILMKVRDRL